MYVLCIIISWHVLCITIACMHMYVCMYLCIYIYVYMYVCSPSLVSSISTTSVLTWPRACSRAH